MALTLPPSLRCTRTPAAVVSKVPDERVGAALRGIPTFRAPDSYIDVRYGVQYPGSRTVWFQGHSGGAGNGEYAEFDPKRHVLARCEHFDTAQSIEIVPAASVPSFIPRGSLTFEPARALRIGSTLADVERIYGRVRPRHTAQGDVYAYERKIPLPQSSLPYVVNTSFVVRNGRVVSIIRFQGI